MLLAACLLSSACSELPSRDWPPLELRSIVAEYEVQAGQPIEVPVSTSDLTILSLQATPAAAAELWRDGRRLLVPPERCRHFVVHCSYRAYLRAGNAPSPAELFPGARVTAWTP